MTALSRVLGALCRLPAPRSPRVGVERDLTARMSDGTMLLADRWAPDPSRRAPGTAPEPILLLRSPYGRRRLGIVGRMMAERGYQVVIQSCRGTFGSGGTFDPFRHERDDGRDTLTWLADQPWFSGSVVTFGPSYLGLTQWALCADPPEYLRALAPSVTATSFRDAVVYPGESFALETTLTWMHQLAHQEAGVAGMLASRAAGRRRLRSGQGAVPLTGADRSVTGQPVGFYQDWLVHDRPGDPWWEPVDFRPFRAAAPPTALVAGWYDIFLPEQVADFTALRHAGRPAHLTIGPWTHASPGLLAATLRDGLAWFDRHARSPGADVGAGRADASEEATVRLFVMGARRWVDLADWPPPATLQRWYLGEGGRLVPEPPGPSAPDAFRYDPADPTPGAGGASLDARAAGRRDQRTREARSDVLVYTSAPLAEDLTVAGPLAADLFFRSSLEHTDLFVRLCVVTDRGRSWNISDGIVRLEPGRWGQAPAPDGIRRVRVGMWPTAFTFRRGQRIRFQVSSGAHPLYARNPGSGEPLGTATTFVVADQEVHRDPDHPSALELPVSGI